MKECGTGMLTLPFSPGQPFHPFYGHPEVLKFTFLSNIELSRGKNEGMWGRHAHSSFLARPAFSRRGHSSGNLRNWGMEPPPSSLHLPYSSLACLSWLYNLATILNKRTYFGQSDGIGLRKYWFFLLKIFVNHATSQKSFVISLYISWSTLTQILCITVGADLTTTVMEFFTLWRVLLRLEQLIKQYL